MKIWYHNLSDAIITVDELEIVQIQAGNFSVKINRPMLYFEPKIAIYKILCEIIFVLVLRLVVPNRKHEFCAILE